MNLWLVFVVLPQRRHKFLSNVANSPDGAIFVTLTHSSLSRKPRKCSKKGLDRSQIEQPIKKKKFSYLARSRLRLRPQEIWERDYAKGKTTGNCCFFFGLQEVYSCSVTTCHSVTKTSLFYPVFSLGGKTVGIYIIAV